ncbi:MAG TPA: hypothetical protein VMH32_01900 [Burkholderiales bacterium]|nr:hypothetical protein [Burkholderiales bacterium]
MISKTRRICLSLACALALAAPGAGAKSRSHAASFDSGWSFTLADVESAHITIDFPSRMPDRAQLKSELRHVGARWTRDGQPFDPSPLASLGQSLRVLVPVLGLHHCPDAVGAAPQRDAWNLQIELAIRTRSHGTLRVRSSSSCAYMLPWHVTNAATLAASYQPQTGLAIQELVIPVCPECRMQTKPMPEPFVAGPNRVRFETLFGALVARWKRLAAKDPEWVAAQTDDLTAALRWMDEGRYQAELRKLLGRRALPPAVRRLAEAELQRLRQKNAPRVSAQVEQTYSAE